VRPGRAVTVIEITGNRVFVMMMRAAMLVFMFAAMHMIMRVFAAIGVAVGMRMGGDRCRFMSMGVIMAVLVRMTMNRAIGMNVRVFVAITLNPGFAGAASANCAHRVTPIRFRFL
jgi:hypothetical protein